MFIMTKPYSTSRCGGLGRKSPNQIWAPLAHFSLSGKETGQTGGAMEGRVPPHTEAQTL